MTWPKHENGHQGPPNEPGRDLWALGGIVLGVLLGLAMFAVSAWR